MDIRQTVGKNIKAYREERGLSQEDLAFKADLHRTYVSGIERGVRNPSVLIIERLAKVLKVRPHQLLEKK